MNQDEVLFVVFFLVLPAIAMVWFLWRARESPEVRAWRKQREEEERARRDALTPAERRAEDAAYDRWLSTRDPRGS